MIQDAIRKILHKLGFHYWDKLISDNKISYTQYCKICSLYKLLTLKESEYWKLKNGFNYNPEMKWSIFTAILTVINILLITYLLGGFGN